MYHKFHVYLRSTFFTVTSAIFFQEENNIKMLEETHGREIVADGTIQ